MNPPSLALGYSSVVDTITVDKVWLASAGKAVSLKSFAAQQVCAQLGQGHRPGYGHGHAGAGYGHWVQDTELDLAINPSPLLHDRTRPMSIHVLMWRC